MADKDRHLRLVHRKKDIRKRLFSGEEKESEAKRVKSYVVCKFCDKSFPTPHYLAKHKRETGHVQKRK